MSQVGGENPQAFHGLGFQVALVPGRLFCLLALRDIGQDAVDDNPQPLFGRGDCHTLPQKPLRTIRLADAVFHFAAVAQCQLGREFAPARLIFRLDDIRPAHRIIEEITHRPARELFDHGRQVAVAPLAARINPVAVKTVRDTHENAAKFRFGPLHPAITFDLFAAVAKGQQSQGGHAGQMQARNGQADLGPAVAGPALKEVAVAAMKRAGLADGLHPVIPPELVPDHVADRKLKKVVPGPFAHLLGCRIGVEHPLVEWVNNEQGIAGLEEQHRARSELCKASATRSWFPIRILPIVSVADGRSLPRDFGNEGVVPQHRPADARG